MIFKAVDRRSSKGTGVRHTQVQSWLYFDQAVWPEVNSKSQLPLKQMGINSFPIEL